MVSLWGLKKLSVKYLKAKEKKRNVMEYQGMAECRAKCTLLRKQHNCCNDNIKCSE